MTSHKPDPKDASRADEQPPSIDRLSRRELLVRLGATGAVIAAAAAGGMALWQPRHFVPGFEKQTGRQLPSFALEAAAALPTMAVTHGQDVDAVVRAALGALGGIERFIKKGDVVVLKPNVAFDRPPSLGATTHPETLRAVATLVREAGAREIFIADNPINNPVGCFLKSGLTAVANDLGIDIMLPEAAAFEPLDMQGEVLRQWTMFHRPFRRATKVIGIAPCKDHNLCHGSMTMKNWYGLLGGRRNQFHQFIHGIVSDFPMMIQPTLVILDGMRVLMSNGPTGGRPSDVKPMNTIVAGTDMVAVDAYGYEKIMERNIAELEYVHKAAARGLGNKDWRSTNWKEVQV